MAWIIYEDEFYTGMTEVLMQNTDAFNSASNNAIRLVPRIHRGDFTHKAFILEESSLVTRRDITSSSDGSATELDSDDAKGPKLYRRYQPEKKMTDLKRAGITPQEYSLNLGRQVGKAKMADFLNTGILGLVTCLGKSSSNYVQSLSATITFDNLADGLAKFGDASDSIVAWLMHGKQAHDLLKASFDVTVESVAGASIVQGNIPGINRPIIISDSSHLKDADGASTSPNVASYKALGLVSGAAILEESEEESVVGREVDGKENITFRTQGEYGYTLNIKGFSYEDATANPNDSALGTVGNWSQVATDTKSTAGIYVETR